MIINVILCMKLGDVKLLYYIDTSIYVTVKDKSQIGTKTGNKRRFKNFSCLFLKTGMCHWVSECICVFAKDTETTTRIMTKFAHIVLRLLGVHRKICKAIALIINKISCMKLGHVQTFISHWYFNLGLGQKCIANRSEEKVTKGGFKNFKLFIFH